MSRGFVKEDDQEEIPFVAPRAFLPDGVTNYITPNGMQQLLDEKEGLLKEKESLKGENEKELRIARNHINAKMSLLQERIGTSVVVDLEKQPKEIVRFGATVQLKDKDEKKINEYQIVGVEEANASKGKISFISPLSKLLMGKKVGDDFVLNLPKGKKLLEIISIHYIQS